MKLKLFLPLKLFEELLLFFKAGCKDKSDRIYQPNFLGCILFTNIQMQAGSRF